MRGMAQRISTTPRQQLKTQQYTVTAPLCWPCYIVRCCCAIYSSELYYYILQEIPVSSPAWPIQPGFNGQDKMPGHDGVTANCKLFFLFFFFQRITICNASLPAECQLASYSSECSILCAVIIKLENFQFVFTEARACWLYWTYLFFMTVWWREIQNLVEYFLCEQ